MADSNVNDGDLPELWSPELWHPDSKTGKIKKQQLPNEENTSEEELISMINEPEQSPIAIPSSVLLPVEEEESETEEDTQAIFS